MGKQLKKKRSNNLIDNITWHIKLHTLGESLHDKMFRVPIYGNGIHEGHILGGQIITSRTIIIIDDVPQQIAIGVGIYEVAKPSFIYERGDSCVSYKDYCKTVMPKSVWQLGSNKSMNMWPLLKPRLVVKSETIKLISKVLRRKNKSKDASIAKITMKCIKVPKTQSANPLFTLVVTQPNKMETLPLYYLALPIFNQLLEYDGIEGEAKISSSLSQLFDYLWPYSDAPRMTKKVFQEHLKEIGCLGIAWRKDKDSVNVEHINNLCSKLKCQSEEGMTIADLLRRIYDSLLIEMISKGTVEKCANPDCPQYFKKTKKLKKHCSLKCAKHLHYLNEKKSGRYQQSGYLKKKRDYMRENYRKS